MIHAINVKIIGFVFGSIIKKTIPKITPKCINKETKELTPFLPPISNIKRNKIIANNSNAFIIAPSFDLQKTSLYKDQLESSAQCQFPLPMLALILRTGS